MEVERHKNYVHLGGLEWMQSRDLRFSGPLWKTVLIANLFPHYEQLDRFLIKLRPQIYGKVKAFRVILFSYESHDQNSLSKF